MKNPAISVIIPMYNAEKFIGECLQSLANQTFQDFEIVIVDDASTDNSIKIAVSFTEKFGERLRIAKLNENSGNSGVPRNFALEAARGKYVYFLDSDDFIKETEFENLYVVAEKFNADVVHAERYFAVRGDKFCIETHQRGEFVTEPTLETFDIGARIEAFTQWKFLWNIWTKLFRRQFLFDNKIKFTETKTFVDFVFTIECLVCAKNYVRVPSVNYFYRIRQESIAHRGLDILPYVDVLRGVINALDVFTRGRKFFQENPQYRFMLIDFFMQMELEKSSATMPRDEENVGRIYDFVKDKALSRNPQDNVALTAYLFVAANLLKGGVK